MIVNNYTVTQLMIAAGLSRSINRAEICRILNCTQGYISKLLSKDDFTDLLRAFKKMPPDVDTKEYKGLGTVMMDVGRFIYTNGENISG